MSEYIFKVRYITKRKTLEGGFSISPSSNIFICDQEKYLIGQQIVLNWWFQSICLLELMKIYNSSVNFFSIYIIILFS